MAEQQISQGAISAIFNDPDRAAAQFPVPVFQCLQIKTLDAKAGSVGAERYRIVLSDVRNYVQCMLATQANHVVHDGLLQRGCIVRLKQFQAQSLNGRNIMIVLDLEVIESLGAPEKIGEPAALDNKTAGPQNTTIGGAGFYSGVKTENVTQESKPQIQKQLPSRETAGSGGGGGARGGGGDVNAPSTIYPIEGLSPYAHKWTIKARVTSKSDIKTWHKASSEGKLFSVNLLDESGEIKATGFNEQCDQYYEMLQEGSVYYISSPCKVQLAKKQFSNLPNDYELTFERDTVIEKAEDQTNVPQVRFNFCNIQELQDVEKDATVDIIGVLKEVQEVSQIVSKTTQKPYDKRELTLVDDTGYSVRVTIWGKTATNFDAEPESIVAFKGTRVSDFGGRSLSLLASGTMSLDPDIAEAHRLKGWYDAQGRNEAFASHNNSMGAATGRKEDVKSILQVKEENLGMENPEYFNLKATIVYIKQDNFAYPACRSETCNKKVVDMGDGTWRCESCNINHDRPQYRYIMSVNVNDHTGQLWLSCFDETARIIMGGKSADELMEIREQDETRLAAEFEAANCRKLNFRCRAKMDSFGDQQRIRYQVMSATQLDYKSEGHKLAEMIKQMSV
ncbi:putative single-stranded DNA-binding protein 68k chain [Podospora appendiculata]|uniref:Replication protein A subunit n=1 Tax=Podospora appendiculata TaxID=314037 RepID=A0AAE0X6F7_9PEZI|nr:putative single-stranded DNA-binding protein 68k chain [Podospora appendiculata]